MLSKYFSSKVFLGISFFGSLLSLTLFSFLKIPFLFSSLQGDMQKNFIFTLLGLISSLSFFIYLVLKKEITSPENGVSILLYLLVPIAIILSTIFSPDFTNSFFGKYISSSNLVFFSSLILSVYIISVYIKNNFERWTWLTIFISSLILTLPIVIAIILLRFNLTNTASYFAYLISNWDVVAVVSALIVVISLVYFETIAFSPKQRLISLSLIVVHMILVLFIIIPDIWYALALSSLGILIISLLHKNKISKKKIYNRLSFYIFMIALFFSIIFSLSNSWTKAGTFTKNIATFSTKYSGINYSFVKPQFKLSFDLGVSRLKKGEIFGAGLNEFNNVWQKEKPLTILESVYWDTEFTSSFSALTTLFVTVGIFGILAILAIISVLVYGVIKNILRKDGNSNLDLDDENKFYFLSSIAIFIFSVALLFLFVNTQLAILMFALSSALLSAHIIKLKQVKISESGYILFFIAVIIILSGSIININRARSISITSGALNNFQKDNDSNKLEIQLLKAAGVANDDTNYRLLTQFYLYKTQQLISASSSTSTASTADLQKQVLASLNSAITSSKTAISIDASDYNNYITLGSVYSFSMNLDKQNKEAYYQNAKDAYSKALILYPKNPSIPLTLAELEYSYNQNSSSTISSIKKSLEIKPNYSAAYYTLSQLAAQNNDRDGALNYAGQAIQADPNNKDAYMQYGIITLNKKDLSKDELSAAYTAFVTVLNIDQTNLTAAYYLAITYTLAKDFERASSVADALSKTLPNDQKIKDLQAFIASQSKNSPSQSSTSTSTPAK